MSDGLIQELIRIFTLATCIIYLYPQNIQKCIQGVHMEAKQLQIFYKYLQRLRLLCLKVILSNAFTVRISGVIFLNSKFISKFQIIS